MYKVPHTPSNSYSISDIMSFLWKIALLTFILYWLSTTNPSELLYSIFFGVINFIITIPFIIYIIILFSIISKYIHGHETYISYIISITIALLASIIWIYGIKLFLGHIFTKPGILFCLWIACGFNLSIGIGGNISRQGRSFLVFEIPAFILVSIVAGLCFRYFFTIKGL